ncbi:MAG: hypothetical protein ACD_19C00135G0002 [uncultured bacterium]|nr:MAG: hypothetical protein ACD_19C00135G0002 [uncultured bacterium]
MSCYTVSHCILLNLDSGKKYITDLLFVFTQETNPFKVAIDKDKKILDLYEKAGQSNQHVATWLNLMSLQPSNFEPINVDTSSAKNEEELFLLVCSNTKNQQKLFVYSHQNWTNFKYDTNNLIVYRGVPVQVLDRDEAINELHPSNQTSINAYNSVLATSQSTISGVTHARS